MRYGEPQCLDHVLLLCPYAQSVSSAVGYSHGYATVVELISVLFDSTKFKKLQRRLFLLWMIWVHCNYLVWKGQGKVVASILRATNNFPFNWLQVTRVFAATEAGKGGSRDAVSQAAGGRVDVTRAVGVVGWEPPAAGVLKCNVDAAWFEQDGATGYTAVVRDCTVLVIKVFFGI
ncbi:hypothetical protein PVK06_048857 [Gossypium arboreum]|uniref:Uncharacterized protein n=1 Tax=Gossypium arboreum TaxID=29729 RepID=A0ABR0MHE4_GOSAR|nr:hypothetical protein PVK06_048857 [Gossypium arboreum]